MRRSISLIHTTGATLLLLALTASLALASPRSADGGHDIGALMATAEDVYDLSREDAVILLEDQTVELLASGGRRTTVHRIVWISTELGIDEYADLRVPWNTETSRLDVSTLRTWRDERWWPHESEISPTAVVATLPHALNEADDYTGVRETMLLHDGVEIPCIVETAYTIEREPDGLGGADGAWIFSRNDPAVRVQFTLVVPLSQGDPAVLAGNGAPEMKRAELDGARAFTWSMEPVNRLPRPPVEDAVSVAPFVAWSTWDSWDDLSEDLLTRFNLAATLTPEIADTLAGRLARLACDRQRAEAVASYLNEATRYVGYDHGHWAPEPRPASRTWETAYGHALDRAVLAAAAFREAGCKAAPLYAGSGYGQVTGRVPGLARFRQIGLWVSGDGFEAAYDPARGSLTRAPSDLAGRAVYRLGIDRTPDVLYPAADGRIEVHVTVEEDDSGGWSGTGYVHGTGVLSQYADVAGLGSEGARALGSVAGVIEGAELTSHGVDVLSPEDVRAGFELSMTPGEADDLGRTHIVMSGLAGGVVDNLPAGVDLYAGARTSPVLLPATYSQKVVVHLNPSSEVYHTPEPRQMDNGAGWFTLSVDKADDGWITVTRELGVNRATLAPEEWPLLRALLLEETDAANRTILLK